VDGGLRLLDAGAGRIVFCGPRDTGTSLLASMFLTNDPQSNFLFCSSPGNAVRVGLGFAAGPTSRPPAIVDVPGLGDSDKTDAIFLAPLMIAQVCVFNWNRRVLADELLDILALVAQRALAQNRAAGDSSERLGDLFIVFRDRIPRFSVDDARAHLFDAEGTPTSTVRDEKRRIVMCSFRSVHLVSLPKPLDNGDEPKAASCVIADLSDHFRKRVALFAESLFHCLDTSNAESSHVAPSEMIEAALRLRTVEPLTAGRLPMEQQLAFQEVEAQWKHAVESFIADRRRNWRSPAKLQEEILQLHGEIATIFTAINGSRRQRALADAIQQSQASLNVLRRSNLKLVDEHLYHLAESIWSDSRDATDEQVLSNWSAVLREACPSLCEDAEVVARWDDLRAEYERDTKLHWIDRAAGFMARMDRLWEQELSDQVDKEFKMHGWCLLRLEPLEFAAVASNLKQTPFTRQILLPGWKRVSACPQIWSKLPPSQLCALVAELISIREPAPLELEQALFTTADESALIVCSYLASRRRDFASVIRYCVRGRDITFNKHFDVNRLLSAFRAVYGGVLPQDGAVADIRDFLAGATAPGLHWSVRATIVLQLFSPAANWIPVTILREATAKFPERYRHIFEFLLSWRGGFAEQARRNLPVAILCLPLLHEAPRGEASRAILEATKLLGIHPELGEALYYLTRTCSSRPTFKYVNTAQRKFESDSEAFIAMRPSVLRAFVADADPFFESVVEGNETMIERTLNVRPEMAQRCHRGVAPIFLALASNRSGVVRQLVDAGGAHQSLFGLRPFDFAVLIEDAALMEQLAPFYSVNGLNPHGKPLLHTCVKYAPSLLRTAMSLGANLEGRDKWNRTPLFDACRRSLVQAAMALVERGASVSSLNADVGKSPVAAVCTMSGSVQEKLDLLKIMVETDEKACKLHSASASSEIAASRSVLHFLLPYIIKETEPQKFRQFLSLALWNASRDDRLLWNELIRMGATPPALHCVIVCMCSKCRRVELPLCRHHNLPFWRESDTEPPQCVEAGCDERLVAIEPSRCCSVDKEWHLWKTLLPEEEPDAMEWPSVEGSRCSLFVCRCCYALSFVVNGGIVPSCHFEGKLFPRKAYWTMGHCADCPDSAIEAIDILMDKETLRRFRSIRGRGLTAQTEIGAKYEREAQLRSSLS
jgi:hypothetical protein